MKDAQQNKNMVPIVIGGIVGLMIIVASLVLINNRNTDTDINQPETIIDINPETISEDANDVELVEPIAVEEVESADNDQSSTNWNDLSSTDKIAINPYNCDLNNQIMWADGTCHDTTNTTGVTTTQTNNNETAQNQTQKTDNQTETAQQDKNNVSVADVLPTPDQYTAPVGNLPAVPFDPNTPDQYVVEVSEPAPTPTHQDPNMPDQYH